MSSVLFKNVINKMCLKNMFFLMYKKDMDSNNLQGLICHKIQPKNNVDKNN